MRVESKGSKVTITPGRRGNVSVGSDPDEVINIDERDQLGTGILIDTGGVIRPLNNVYAGPTPPPNPKIGTVWIKTGDL